MVTGTDSEVDPTVPISSMDVVPVLAFLEAVHVIVTFVLLLAFTLTGSADAVAETPLGNSLTLRSTDTLDEPELVIVSIVLKVLPSSIVNVEGAIDRLKPEPPVAALTVTATVVVCVRLPEVPVIVTVAVPVAAVALAVRVSVLVPLLPEAGVTDVGLNEAVTPLGRPEADSATALSKPFCEVIVIVLVPLSP